MAAKESIDEFVSQAAIKQVDDLVNKLTSAEKQMTSLVNETIRLNNELNKSNGLNQFAKSSESSKKATEQLNTETKAFIQTFTQYENLVTKLAAAQSEEGKELAKLQAQLNAVNKANRENAKSTQEQVDAYTKLVRSQKAAEREYLNLAATLGINDEATKKAAASNKLLFDQLSEIEQGGGNFRRNVGNYTSGFQSFSQVLREAPAFGVNVNTGLLALSNNLPILADEIKRARDAGQSFGQILKGLGNTVISFGGIVTVLTTVLTFLPQIIQAFDDTNGKIKNFSDVQAEAIKSTQKEKIELEALLVVAQSDNKSRTEKQAAIKKINDIMPDYLGKITEENVKTGEAALIIDVYIESLQRKGRAIAYITKLQELQNKLLDLENSELEDNASTYDKIAAITSNLGNLDRAYFVIQEEGLKKRNESIKVLKSQIELLKEQFNNDLETGKAQLDLDKIERQRNETRENTIESLEKLTGQSKSFLDSLNTEQQRNALDLLADKYVLFIDGQLQGNQNLLEAQLNFNTGYKAILLARQILANEVSENITKKEKEEAEKRKKIEEENQRLRIELIRQVASSLTDIIGSSFDVQKNRIQEQIDENDRLKQSEIERVSQSVASEEEKANKISVINARSQAQKEQLERKQRELDQKKAVAEKAKAVFDIILSTAVAVMRQLQIPNIPGSFLVGAIGAAQLAAVLSRPIPKFAKGTDNSPEGPAIVGEEGRELMISPKGQISYTPDTATLTYLEKGTKIIPRNKLKDMALDGLSIGSNRYVSNNTLDLSSVTNATNNSADKITRAIKMQPKTILTKDGLFSEYKRNNKLNNYYRRNLR